MRWIPFSPIPSKRAAAVLLALGASALLIACTNKTESPPVPGAAADSRRQDYDLSEQCARNAREWFSQFFGNGTQNGGGAESQSEYSNHYNKKLNICIALQSVMGTTRDSKTGKVSVFESKGLVDVNENKDLGDYFKFVDPEHLMICSVNGKSCRSRDEWEDLARPYMTQ